MKLRMETGGIGGQTLWGPLPNTTDYYLLWPGVGARLYLVIRPRSADGQLIPIEHTTADGTYGTRQEAERAVAAFVAALEFVSGLGDD